MHSRFIASIGLAGLLLASPAFASDASCCKDMKAGAPCCDMPCCKDQAGMPMASADLNIMEMLFEQQPAPAVVTPPARQATVVWFHQPVRIGNNILQGRYVIEHDNDRMAAGGPCTYIYAWDDQTVPVVAFHCVHLDRPGVDKTTVVLSTGSDGFKRLVEFQFPGDSGGHGTPTIR
ncbi:MAG: hypothetical protein AB7P34_10415 [Vicinamibacterales bacterium]